MPPAEAVHTGKRRPVLAAGNRMAAAVRLAIRGRDEIGTGEKTTAAARMGGGRGGGLGSVSYTHLTLPTILLV